MCVCGCACDHPEKCECHLLGVACTMRVLQLACTIMFWILDRYPAVFVFLVLFQLCGGPQYLIAICYVCAHTLSSCYHVFAFMS